MPVAIGVAISETRAMPQVLVHDFTRILKVRLESGESVQQAVSELAIKERDQRFRWELEEMVFALSHGKLLFEALRGRELYFNEFYVSVVAAGEAGNRLGKMLGELADFMAKEAVVWVHITKDNARPARFAIFLRAMRLLLRCATPVLDALDILDRCGVSLGEDIAEVRCRLRREADPEATFASWLGATPNNIEDVLLQLAIHCEKQLGI